MQTVFLGDEYRIEYSDGDISNLQHCMVDIDKACELLQCFYEGRDVYQTAVDWKPTKLPGKSDKVAVIGFCILVLLLFGFIVWANLH